MLPRCDDRLLMMITGTSPSRSAGCGAHEVVCVVAGGVEKRAGAGKECVGDDECARFSHACA